MIQDLMSQMSGLGYNPREIALDGKIHRFDVHGKKDGWLVGYQNSTRKGDIVIVALFGSWKTGEEHEYKSSVVLSREDKKALEVDIQKAQAEKTIARQVVREETSEYAERIWLEASENPKVEYLERKKVNGLYGCKTAIGAKGRELLVPMRDANSKLWGIQRILNDGTKLFLEGQRKESCFHVIPFVESLDETDTIYVTEGFATGATVWEAIQKPVVIGFDSGNLLSVVRAIKEKYKDKAIIICGDDDRFTKNSDGVLVNAGRDSGEAAAAAVLGKCVFPKFKANNGTDFNDLMALEGLEQVKNQIMGVKPEFHAVHCLGYQEGSYYFISSDKPQVTVISSGAFSKLSLLDLMPMAFWETNYPSKNGPSWDTAIDNLMRGCRKKGRFIPKNVRGAGVWKDNKKTVVNTGEVLWVDGEILSYREHKSKFIYQVAERAMIPRQDFATTEEANQLANALQRLSWKKPESAKLLLGWIAIANIAGCLPWRPHVWITGPSGSGKSFVMNSIISIIFGKNSVKVLGSTTEAGLRQRIGSDARPVIFDELETDDEKSGERVKSVIELCRQASSETDAEVVKGTSHGKSISFSVRFAAIVSSIRPNLQHEQDKNRFALMELLRDEENNFTGENGVLETINRLLTEDFIEKIYSRSVHKVDLILQNNKTFYNAMIGPYNGRFADQYGILLAGYYAMLQDTPVCPEEAKYTIEHFIKLDEQAEETVNNGRDEEELLNHITGSLIRTREGDYKVSELIMNCVSPVPVIGAMQSLKPAIDNEENRILQRYGIRVVDQNTIAIKPRDTEFSKMVKNTKWASSSRKILMRIEGAELTRHRIHGKASWCVNIPNPCVP